MIDLRLWDSRIKVYNIPLFFYNYYGDLIDVDYTSAFVNEYIEVNDGD